MPVGSLVSRHLGSWLYLFLASTVSCGIGAPPPPVPVQEARQEVSAVAGEWDGRYWSKDTGRHGTIRFMLPERADTGFGEVEITFSPSLHLLFEDTEENRNEPKPSTILDIRVVRVEGQRVQGTMVPYWDPDCNCRASTVFDGKLAGDRISGTFTSRRTASQSLVTGEWQAVRKLSEQR